MHPSRLQPCQNWTCVIVTVDNQWLIIPIHLYISCKKKKLFSNRETIKCYSWMDISFRRFEIHSNGFTIELVHILIWHSYTLSCKSYFVVCHTSRTIKIRLKTISICGTQSYVFISDNGARNHKDKGWYFCNLSPTCHK